MKAPRLSLLSFLAFCLIISTSGSIYTVSHSIARTDQGVRRALRASEPVSVIVSFKSGNEEGLEQAQASFEGGCDRKKIVPILKKKLQTHADKCQRELDELIQSTKEKEKDFQPCSKSFTSSVKYWISNEAYFQHATPEFIEKVLKISGVDTVREERVFPAPSPYEYLKPESNVLNTTAEGDEGAGGSAWGVERIGAHQVWRRGYTGTNVVVGVIDTGVSTFHQDLWENYVGDYGWLDAVTGHHEPFDDMGHGTHITGTIVGKNGIGVAPDAKYMSCRACDVNGCREGSVRMCVQFMLCPWLPGQEYTEGDCSRSADVINNSWGGGENGDFFRSSLRAMEVANVHSFYSVGNNGPTCGTVAPPADIAEAEAIGATDYNDAYAEFSSKGPTANGVAKPDLSAPGTHIRSASHLSMNGYESFSGSSMATPHVTGTAALLLSANPSLSTGDLKWILEESSYKEISVSAAIDCGQLGIEHGEVSGVGRLDARNAMESLVPS